MLMLYKIKQMIIFSTKIMNKHKNTYYMIIYIHNLVSALINSYMKYIFNYGSASKGTYTFCIVSFGATIPKIIKGQQKQFYLHNVNKIC